MLYNNQNLKKTMLGVLKNRTSSIADCIQNLISEGYVPNKNKTIILSWSTLLIHAYENIDVFDKEQHDKLDNLYNKVLKL